nr:hypothetical protein [Anaerolineae bacterium]
MAPHPLRLLVICQQVDPTETLMGFFATWLLKLAARVERMIVVPLWTRGVEWPDNVTVFPMQAGPSGKRLARWVRLNSLLARLILGHQVDVVFVHMIPRWASLAAPYCRLSGVPIVLWYAHKAVPWLLYPAHCLARRVVTSTPEGYRLSQDSTKVHVVGQGIDTEYFHPVPR